MSEEAAVPVRPTRVERTMAALRQRDWLGIAIELAVVVLGILIAFQIDQWGDRRAKAREERQFLLRLHLEYGRAAREMQERVIRHHDSVKQSYRLAFRHRADRARLQALSALTSGCDGGYFMTAPFSDTLAQELISAGKLDIIQDPALRGSIRDLTTKQAEVKDRAAAGARTARDEGSHLIKYYQYQLKSDGSTTCSVLWPGLLEDPIAVTAALRTYRMHELAVRGRRELLQQTLQVRNKVGCTLGDRACVR